MEVINKEKFLQTLETEGADIYQSYSDYYTEWGFSRDSILSAIDKSIITIESTQKEN